MVQACRLAEQVISAGWVDGVEAPEIVAQASAACVEGRQGLLSSLLRAPAWQIEALPAFEKTPLPLWGALATACFRLPRVLSGSGQAEAMLRHRTRRIRELAQLAERNPGSAGVRTAAAAAEASGDPAVLFNCSACPSEYLKWRSRLRYALRERNVPECAAAISRENRALVIGIIGPSPARSDSQLPLSWCLHLDSRRFQTIWFVIGGVDRPASESAEAVGIDVRVLDRDVMTAAATLVHAGLDIALFATNSGNPGDEPCRLLQHRIAPLQVAIDARGFTTGLPTADALLAEHAAAAGREDQYVERLILLPDAGLFATARPRHHNLARSWTREALGVPAGAVLFSTVSAFAQLTPDWVAAVAGILARLPQARLLVYSDHTDDAGAAGLERVCRTLGPALEQNRISSDRLLISNETFEHRADVVALLSRADLHLDLFPVSDVAGCRLALEAGVPVLTLAPATGGDNSTASRVRALGLHDCVVPDQHAYSAAAAALASDPERLGQLRVGLAQALAAPGAFGDTLLRAESAGLLLEFAFDQVCAGEFGSNRAPLRLTPGVNGSTVIEEAAALLDAGSPGEALDRLAAAVAQAPLNLRARTLYYRALIAAGEGRRAESGLTEVATHSADPELWNLLAIARARQGRRQEAIAALRVSLRLAPRNLTTWRVLDDLARSGGHAGLAEEIRSCFPGITAPAAD